VLIGVGWVVKLQLLLLATLTCSIVSFFIGALKPEEEDLPFANIWLDGTLIENLLSEYEE